MEKIALFIDGANLFATTKTLNVELDYRRMLEYFSCRNSDYDYRFVEEGFLVRAYYYTAVREEEPNTSLKTLLDWLQYNGFIVVTKPTKEFRDQISGKLKIKGNMDIELALDAMTMAKSVDHIIIFSGDGDFRYLVQKIQDLGVKVTVVSTIMTTPSMIADELRRQADAFIDVYELAKIIPRNGR